MDKICETCNKGFYVSPCRAKVARFCCHPCYAKTVCLQKKTDKWYNAMDNITPWNKGKEWSSDIKSKISISQKKRFASESAWNKGLEGFMSGDKHYAWKGESVGYHALHHWINRQLGTPQHCSICNDISDHRYHWANVSGKYHRVKTDWIRLCPKCHKNYDKENKPASDVFIIKEGRFSVRRGGGLYE